MFYHQMAAEALPWLLRPRRKEAGSLSQRSPSGSRLRKQPQDTSAEAPPLCGQGWLCRALRDPHPDSGSQCPAEDSKTDTEKSPIRDPGVFLSNKQFLPYLFILQNHLKKVEITALADQHRAGGFPALAGSPPTQNDEVCQPAPATCLPAPQPLLGRLRAASVLPCPRRACGPHGQPQSLGGQVVRSWAQRSFQPDAVCGYCSGLETQRLMHTCQRDI